jgi:hypothetical protein
VTQVARSSRQSAEAAGWSDVGTRRERPARSEFVLGLDNALRGRPYEFVEQDVQDRLARRQQPALLRWGDQRVLWRSRNDLIIGRLHPDQIGDERARWVAAARAQRGVSSLVIDATHLETFSTCIVGDPGDGDASQYAVARALEHVAQGTPFMVLLSDIIYPAGDINEYIDKLYLPYEGYGGTIYGVVGNHDWYDGLNGFMFHFCGLEPLPRPRYRSASLGRRARIAQRLFRRASAPRVQTLLAARASRLPWSAADRASSPNEQVMPAQPGPYFAIETSRLLFVAVDTGIKGTIDRQQAEWLLDVVEASEKPKILLTGKPIYVDGEYNPCEIERTRLKRSDPQPLASLTEHPCRNGATFTTLDEIVRTRSYDFRVVLGGDVHNYQRYSMLVSDEEGSRRIEYVVSGGGGAYLSTTHRIDRVQLDADAVPEDVTPLEEDDSPDGRFRCYPLRGDAVALYSHFVRIHLPRYVFSALEFFALSVLVASLIVPDSTLDNAAAGPVSDEWRIRAVLAAGLFSMPLLYSLIAWVERVHGLVVAIAGLALSSPLWVLHDKDPWRIAAGVAAMGSAVLLAFFFGEGLYRQRGNWWKALGTFALTAGVLLFVPAFVAFTVGWDVFFPLLAAYLFFAAVLLALIRHGRRGDIHHFPTRLWAVSVLASVLILVDGYYNPSFGIELTGWVAVVAASVVAWAFVWRLSRNRWVRWGVVALFVLLYVGTLLFLTRKHELAAAYLILLGVVPIAYLLFSGALRVTSARQGDVIDANLASAWIGREHGLKPVRPAARRDVPGRLWRRWLPFGVSASAKRDLRSLATFRAVQRLPRAATSGPLRDFFSELLDFDEPPLFKNFLKIDVAESEVTVTCYGVTGWSADLDDLPVEDSFTIPLSDPPT